MESPGLRKAFNRSCDIVKLIFFNSCEFIENPARIGPLALLCHVKVTDAPGRGWTLPAVGPKMGGGGK